MLHSNIMLNKSIKLYRYGVNIYAYYCIKNIQLQINWFYTLYVNFCLKFNFGNIN